MADGSDPQKPNRSDATSEVLAVPLESLAIRRLIEEVRAEAGGVPRSYNRTFNRHNR